MTRHQRVGLREAIIRVSLDIGGELGEEGLTMRGIASRLGVSATALYQHFDSKAAILREIRLYGAAILQREVFDTVASLPDPIERISAAAENYVAFARAHPWLYTVMMADELVDYSDMSPDEITTLLKPLTTLRGWLREGVEKGRVRAGVDPDMTSIRMWAALHGLCSMLNSGRIDEDHPAFPVTDTTSFLRGFIASVVRTIEAGRVSAD